MMQHREMRMMKIAAWSFVSCVAVGFTALAEAQQAEERIRADLVVVNASIWTGDPDQPQARALVVRDGRFIAVGREREFAHLIDPAAPIINAYGGRVLPGLIDAHVHLRGAASDMRHLDLRSAISRDELLDMLSEYAKKFDEDAWVVATRWSAESWPDQRAPDADEIDQAVGGRKAVLIRMDGHQVLASRSALEYAGITKDGPADPPGGSIGRLEDGTPTGALYEQAQALVMRKVNLPPVDETELLLRAVSEANRLGLTQVGAIEPMETIDRLAALDRDGRLTLQIRATVTGGGDSVSDWMTTFNRAAENRQPSDNVRIIGFKGFMDGTLGSRTAWMMEPYEDNQLAPDKAADNAGFPLAMAASGELKELIRIGAEMGLQPAVHAIGDQANHVLLDWYEAVLTADLRSQLRPRIEHVQHLLPEDVPRFAMLNVMASMQPYHKADDGRYARQRLGPVRILSSYAFRDLLDAGALLAFGSDWPVVSADPFLGIHAAVAAKTLDGKEFVPRQSITVEEALVCYTRNAARCLLNEEESGMIKTGYRADFIILDRDILSIPVDEIPRVRIIRTVVGGTTVYQSE